jgi:hypothetical protein
MKDNIHKENYKLRYYNKAKNNSRELLHSAAGMAIVKMKDIISKSMQLIKSLAIQAQK